MFGLLFGLPVEVAVATAAVMEAASDAAKQTALAEMAERQANAERDFLVEANEEMVAPTPCRFCGTRSKGVHRCVNCGGSR